jgi:hypothetical protein
MSGSRGGSRTGLRIYAQRLLAERFPDLKWESRIGSHVTNGRLSGEVNSKSQTWLVEIATVRSLRYREKIDQIVQRALAYRSAAPFGVLIVLTEDVPRKEPLLIGLRRKIPNLNVEIITISDIEKMIGFGRYADEYPGAVATIGHNSDEYQNAVEATDAVLNCLQTSNDHGLTADVRDRLLVEVKAGRSLLEGKFIRVAALGHTIVPALKFIAENCAKVVVGELAKKALYALVALIFK